jgi:hypothetical protein
VSTPGQYFQGNPTLLADISTVSGTSSDGFPNLPRAPGCVAEAHFQWPEGAGCLHLVPLHDQQQRILWYLGQCDAGNTGIPVLPELCTTRMPITRVATYDSKNILAAYATYDLPVGKGKASATT